VREARGFGELHAIYDVNESVLAGAAAVGWEDVGDGRGMRVQGEAVAVVHCALDRYGFAGLGEIVAGNYPA
jgi:hypothetical protein